VLFDGPAGTRTFILGHGSLALIDHGESPSPD
jgi:hypothetical protein